jgi:hypothetical protein
MEEKYNWDNLPKRNIYKVPEDYFERLPSRIMKRCEQPEVVARPSWFGLVFSPVRVAMATLVLGGALITGIIAWDQPSPDSSSPDISLAEISNEEIMQYLLASGQVDPLDMAELSVADADFWQELGSEPNYEN